MSTTRITNSSTPSPSALGPMTPSATDAAKAQEIKTRTDLAMPAGASGGDDGASGKNYGVRISDDAKSRAAAHQKALNIARGTPDVREDRVAALKKQIEAGTYQVDSGKIADGMLREAIKEHLAENER